MNQNSTVLSTNTGKPAEYTYQGKTIQTSMRRTPQPNGVRVLFDRVDGDVFAGAHVHGIKTAVVYAYDGRVFKEWEKKFGFAVETGFFGENLTLSSLDEGDVFVGDEWQVGDVHLRSTAPRYPCTLLNFSFGRGDVQQSFLDFRKPGVYFEVLQEGTVRPGDTFQLIKRGAKRWSVLDFFDTMKAMRVGPKDAHAMRAFAGMGTDTDVPEIYRARFAQAATATP